MSTAGRAGAGVGAGEAARRAAAGGLERARSVRPAVEDETREAAWVGVAHDNARDVSMQREGGRGCVGVGASVQAGKSTILALSESSFLKCDVERKAVLMA